MDDFITDYPMLDLTYGLLRLSNIFLAKSNLDY